MDISRVGLLFGGLLILILVMLRLMAKNRMSGEAVKKDIKIRERAAFRVEPNDYGQKIKWAVDIDDGKNGRSSGGSEPPAGRGR